MWSWRGKGTLSERLRRGPSPVVEVYQEADFRYFLGIERQRAERRGRSLLLVLVNVRAIGAPTSRTEAVAGIVSDVLGACVRESDFTGWYRQAEAAGAVLVQGDALPSPEKCREIGRRVSGLFESAPPKGAPIDVKVLQLDARRKAQHA
jgi:hypothetical protein